MAMRYLTAGEKSAELEWQSQDPEIDPWIAPYLPRINALPGIVVTQASAGGRASGMTWFGNLWLRCDAETMQRIHARAFELSCNPLIFKVGIIFTAQEQEVVEIQFYGVGYDCLDESMETVIHFLEAVASKQGETT